MLMEMIREPEMNWEYRRKVGNFRHAILAKSIRDGNQCTGGGVDLDGSEHSSSRVRKEKAKVVGIDAGGIVHLAVGKIKCSSLAEVLSFQCCMK